MSKEITNAWILQQLEDEFKLREWIPERFLFSETVVPTFDIHENIQDAVCDLSSMSITSATGFLFFIVPQNERWYLNGYNVIFMAAGAYKVTGVYIKRIKELYPDTFIYLDMTLGQTVSYAVDLPKSVRLDPGDTLNILVDDYTSTNWLRLIIDYTREVIR